MTDYVALHAIERAKTEAHPNIAPTEVFQPTEGELPSLVAARAIRTATPEEVAAAKAKGTYRVGKDVAVTEVVASKEPTDREKLEARAKELDIEFSSNIGDAKLAERVAEAEKKKAAATSGGSLV